MKALILGAAIVLAACSGAAVAPATAAPVAVAAPPTTVGQVRDAGLSLGLAFEPPPRALPSGVTEALGP
jgi:hypothetical protein